MRDAFRLALSLLVFAGQFAGAAATGVLLAVLLHAECMLIQPAAALWMVAILTVVAGFIGFSAAIDAIDRALAVYVRRKSTP